jgi:hypothetical protein
MISDVKFVPQWESFDDYIRLSFSFANEGDAPRTVRLSLTSVLSSDSGKSECSASCFINGITWSTTLTMPLQSLCHGSESFCGLAKPFSVCEI